MVFATIVGGLVSIGITTVAGLLLQKSGLYQDDIGIIGFFIFTGPIEETSKLLGFLFFIRIFKVQFDEPVDAVVYMSCVALGFSLIENLGYTLGAPYLLGVRSVTALVASFFHGLYDALVFVGIVNTTYLYLLIMLAMFWGKKVFGYALLNSPHRRNMLSVLTLGKPTASKLCIACGKDFIHNTYAFLKEAVEECQACQHIVLPEKKADNFLNYFLPHHQIFVGKNEELRGKLNEFFREVHEENYNAHRKIKMAEASLLIENLAEEFRKAFERSSIFSFVFATRPILAAENGIVNEQYGNMINSDGFKIVMTLFLFFAGTGVLIWALLALLT